jgi:hypothetical protein
VAEDGVGVLQRQAGNHAVDRLLRGSASPRALPPDLRREMERQLGTDLQSVRIHDDSAAGRQAAAMGAKAFTVGEDIVFGRDRFDPTSPAGRHLIAHEFAHVVQQRRGGGASPRTDGSGALESAAGEAADALTARTGPIGVDGSSAIGPAAQPQDKRERAPPKDEPTPTPEKSSPKPQASTANPRLTIVDYGNGLSDKEMKSVVTEAKKALDETTQQAQDPALKKRGVEVTFQRGLKGIEGLRKKGDILVYLIHDTKDDRKLEGVVRDILTAEGALKGDRLDEITKRVTGDLSVTVKEGKVFGQHVRDRASNVAFINLDLTPGRSDDSLRAIAGDVLHEGVGHRAIPPPQGESTYHNPQDKGVMSKDIREKATKKDIFFQRGERDQVNEFLKSILDNPGWNKD